MKKYLKMLVLFTAFAVLVSGSIKVNAQVKVGGYKTVSARDAGVVEAADIAVSGQNASDDSIVYELVAVKTAQRQTVQGTNYRLCLQIIATDAETDTDYEYARAIVYRSLQGDYQLKSWTETKGCGR